MNKHLAAIAVLGLLASPARAAAPELIPLQGVLTDDTGTPVDGSITVVFSIYTTEIGGTAVWSETQDLYVENGFFTAYLGDVTALDLTLFRDNGNLWLGVQIDADSEMTRSYLGSNPFAGYAEYCGTVPDHGHDFSDLTGTVDPGMLPGGALLGPQACTGTNKVSGVDTAGTLVCNADEGTSYSAGTGLILGGTTFSANTSYLQRRVTGTCTSGAAIAAINGDGTVTCVTGGGTGDITGVTAGTGLTGGGISGTVTLNLDTAYTDGRYVNTGEASSVTSSMIVNNSITSTDVDSSSVQVRVTGTCPAGNYVYGITSTGGVNCRAESGGGGSVSSSWRAGSASTVILFDHTTDGGFTLEDELTGPSPWQHTLRIRRTDTQFNYHHFWDGTTRLSGATWTIGAEVSYTYDYDYRPVELDITIGHNERYTYRCQGWANVMSCLEINGY
ncbi:MAG: hypothetical protein JRG91_14120 [Deltaproteobacteria bacterium]|nr:hypothetical protein [Deltaproteobacteria bacterium]